jgi:hypothetical protein
MKLAWSYNYSRKTVIDAAVRELTAFEDHWKKLQCMLRR